MHVGMHVCVHVGLNKGDALLKASKRLLHMLFWGEDYYLILCCSLFVVLNVNWHEGFSPKSKESVLDKVLR